MNNPVRAVFRGRQPFPNQQELSAMQTDRLNEDIRDAMGTVRQAAPDVGELSAAAIKQRFEEGASALDQMALDLTQNMRENEASALSVVTACERLREQTLAVVEQCNRTATVYREEAMRHGERIKAASDLAGRVKAACEELSAAITAPATL